MERVPAAGPAPTFCGRSSRRLFPNGDFRAKMADGGKRSSVRPAPPAIARRDAQHRLRPEPAHGPAEDHQVGLNAGRRKVRSTRNPRLAYKAERTSNARLHAPDPSSRLTRSAVQVHP